MRRNISKQTGIVQVYSLWFALMALTGQLFMVCWSICTAYVQHGVRSHCMLKPLCGTEQDNDRLGASVAILLHRTHAGGFALLKSTARDYTKQITSTCTCRNVFVRWCSSQPSNEVSSFAAPCSIYTTTPRDGFGGVLGVAILLAGSQHAKASRTICTKLFVSLRRQILRRASVLSIQPATLVAGPANTTWSK